MNVAEKRKFAQGKWYHRIYLGDGITTNANPDNRPKWKCIAKRMKIKGARIVDLGCAEGYYGLKALCAGASRVLFVDFAQKRLERLRKVMGIHSVNGQRYLCSNLDLNSSEWGPFCRFQEPSYVIALALIHWLKSPSDFLVECKKFHNAKVFVEFHLSDDYPKEYAMWTNATKLKWHFTKSMSTRLMKLAGFEDVKIIKDYVTSFGAHRIIVEGCA